MAISLYGNLYYVHTSEFHVASVVKLVGRRYGEESTAMRMSPLEMVSLGWRNITNVLFRGV